MGNHNFRRIHFFLFVLLACNFSAGALTLHADDGKTDVLDIHHLPLGDGKISTSPQRGYVYSCQTQFGGGGAQEAGPWIHGDTWDLTEKISVQGDVPWPQASFH